MVPDHFLTNIFFHNLVFGYFRAIKVKAIIANIEPAAAFGNLNPKKPMIIVKKNIMHKVFAILFSLTNLTGLNLPNTVHIEVSYEILSDWICFLN